jgi:hypothetical protein
LPVSISAVEFATTRRRQNPPSQRDVIVNVARTWAKTAEVIDRHVREGRGEVLPDLRRKLN